MDIIIDYRVLLLLLLHEHETTTTESTPFFIMSYEQIQISPNISYEYETGLLLLPGTVADSIRTVPVPVIQEFSTFMGFQFNVVVCYQQSIHNKVLRIFHSMLFHIDLNCVHTVLAIELYNYLLRRAFLESTQLQ